MIRPLANPPFRFFLLGLLAGLALLAAGLALPLTLTRGADHSLWPSLAGLTLAAFGGSGAAWLLGTRWQGRQSDQLYRTLFDQAGDGFFVANAAGRYTHVNASGCRMLGYTPAELTQLTIRDLVPADEQQRAPLRLGELAPGRPLTTERWLLRRDGSRLLVEISATPLPDGTFLGLVRDITLRREAEHALRASEARYRLLFERNPHPMWVYDLATLAFLAVNDAAVAHYGYSREEFLTLTIKDIRPAEDVPALLRNVAATDDGLAAAGVWRHRRKDGTLLEVEITSHTLPANGQRSRLVLAHDVTARRQAETALRDAERLARATVDALPAHLAILDEQGVILSVNRAWREFAAAQHAAPETVGEGANYLVVCDTAVGPDAAEAAAMAAGLRAVIAGRQPEFTLEYPCHVPDEQRWFLARVTRFDGAGPVRVVVAHENITARQLAEAARHQSDAHYRRLAENAQDLIYRYQFQPERGFTYVSPAATPLTGYTPEDHYADPDLGFKLVHPDDRPLLAGLAHDAAAFKQPLTLRWQRQDGSIIWTEQRNVPVFDDAGRLVAMEGIARDVSERVRVEQALRAKTAELDRYFTASLDLLCIADTAGHFRRLNPEWEKTLGYPLAELEGRRFLDLVHPDDLAATLAAMDQLAGQAEVRNFTNRYRRQDGSYCWLEWRSYPQGELIYAVARDITDRVLAADQLRLQAAALEAAANGIVITDHAGTIEWVNPAFTALTGYTAAECVGRNPRALVRSGRHDQAFYQALWDTILAGRVWRGELVNRRKDGGLYTEEQIITPVRDGQAAITHFVAIKQDITTRKQHERELEIVAAVSAALRAAESRAEMAPVILDQLIALLAVAGAALAAFDADGEAVIIELGRGALAALTGQRLPVGAGLTGPVLENGWPYLNNAVQDDPRLFLPDMLADCRAVAGAPLTVGSQVMGLLWIGSRRPLDQHDLRLLTAVSDIAASALHRAALHEQTRRRADEFAALYATARELAVQPDLDWLLEALMAHVLDLAPAAGAFVALNDPVDDGLRVAAVRGLPVGRGMRLPLAEGAAGQAAQTWQPVRVADYRIWEGRLPQFDAVPFSSMLNVPLLSGGTLIGALVLANLGPAGRPFSQAEAELVTLLASHAAGAIHNAQVFEEARRRADQLAFLYDAGLALNGTLEPHSQLEYLAKVAGQALRAEVVEFYRADPQTETLMLDLSVGYQPAAGASLNDHAPHFVSERGLAGAVAHTRLPVSVPDLLADPRYVVVDPELRSGLWVPVQHQGRLRGVLGVLSRQPKAFTAQDERLLLLFANQTAVAIQNAHLFAETERRLRQVQALRQIDVALASSLELRPVLNVLLTQTVTQLGVDAAAVLLYDPHTQQLRPAASHGFRSPGIEHACLPLGRGLAGRAAQIQQRVLIPDLAHSAEPWLRAEPLAADGFLGYCAEPLVFRGRVNGVLEVFHRAPLHPDDEWLNFLATLAGQAALTVENVGLFEELQRSNTELTRAYAATIEGWSRALDLRDQETEGHSRRVTELTLALAGGMGISPAELTHVRRGALLHDIGKMGVPDAILRKAGPLTDEEWAVMRTHPTLAFEMLSPIAFLRPALDIPYCHHEKWDGTGYPRGLRGEQIPLAARLFAVVDVWDALTSDRSYRPAWPPERALAYIQAQAGLHFDPQAVAIFTARFVGPATE